MFLWLHQAATKQFDLQSKKKCLNYWLGVLFVRLKLMVGLNELFLKFDCFIKVIKKSTIDV